MKAYLNRARQGWKAASHWLGERQATVVYTFLYAFIVGPVALVRRPFWDPFQYRKRWRSSFWVSRVQAPATLEEARRQ
ncbi:MAG: hypothetical protein HY613_09585 [Candidatus Rokubacteria bacterium]|nr:hypothetical protein [Candidatus Rokubacteria bacterium]